MSVQDDDRLCKDDFITTAGQTVFQPTALAYPPSIEIYVNGAMLTDTAAYTIDLLGNVTLTIPRYADETVTLTYTRLDV